VCRRANSKTAERLQISGLFSEGRGSCGPSRNSDLLCKQQYGFVWAWQAGPAGHTDRCAPDGMQGWASAVPAPAGAALLRCCTRQQELTIQPSTAAQPVPSETRQGRRQGGKHARPATRPAQFMLCTLGPLGAARAARAPSSPSPLARNAARRVARSRRPRTAGTRCRLPADGAAVRPARRGAGERDRHEPRQEQVREPQRQGPDQGLQRGCRGHVHVAPGAEPGVGSQACARRGPRPRCVPIAEAWLRPAGRKRRPRPPGGPGRTPTTRVGRASLAMAWRRRPLRRRGAAARGAGGALSAAPPPPPAEVNRLLANKTQALQLFEDPSYDVSSFFNQHFANLSEKAVETVRGDLTSLSDYCTSEVRRRAGGRGRPRPPPGRRRRRLPRGPTPAPDPRPAPPPPRRSRPQ
jgi:hypothetical protein